MGGKRIIRCDRLNSEEKPIRFLSEYSPVEFNDVDNGLPYKYILENRFHGDWSRERISAVFTHLSMIGKWRPDEQDFVLVERPQSYACFVKQDSPVILERGEFTVGLQEKLSSLACIPKIEDAYSMPKFLAWRPVSGHSIARAKLILPEKVQVCADLAECVVAACDAGVYLGEISPAAVILSKEGLKLIGIYAASEGERKPVGPLEYFAPETLRGYPADEFSNVASLGKAVYCILAGRPMFPKRDYEIEADYINEVCETNPFDVPFPDVFLDETISFEFQHILAQTQLPRHERISAVDFATELMNFARYTKPL